MTDINVPTSVLPKDVHHPAAFIAAKNSDLPDYGISTGDIVLVDQDSGFEKGELSVYKYTRSPIYRISNRKRNAEHFGKVVMVIHYYGNRPMI